MKLLSRVLGALLAASLPALPAQAATDEETMIEKSMTVLRDLQAIPDTRIPDLLLSRAEGIVILPRAGWEGLRETMHLLGTSANARRLIDSISERDAGKGSPHDIIEP